MLTTTYFIYDSFAMFRRPICGLNFDIQIVLHHGLVLSALIYSLYFDTSCRYLTLTVFLSEISNPAMNLRGLL